MGTMEAPIAIRRLETDREDVFAFDVVGRVAASDVENIYGLIEGAYALHDKIDVLVRIKDYDGVDWDAAKKDFSLLSETRALKHIRRYAVVGGPGWFGPMIAVLKPFFSLRMKHFDADEEAEAWAWIGATEIPPRT
ncbi:MAG TPA: STAS/SEC14 domain-containing protein [Reyranella sp.]|jgi:hypothetical protein|nr:STAS/SEC14 domain-containing protein [Reyranella sp.]